ncbi:MAG: Stk1 family PASTA domain-containing Ser/Thr kinase [Christensenellales bacterium]|jgi:beta-lactam-binding protein with PASTA domain
MITKLHSRYEILEEVGCGGMATVYKARKKQTGEIVALKVLKQEFITNAGYLRNFIKEGESLEGFSHENIVGINELECIDGVYYIEMEYIEGETLKEYVRRKGPLPCKEAADIAIQICRALAYTHEKNLIHRDIKSQNILILSDGKIKVADFGIARDVSSSTMTYGGDGVMGSVHYLSPEQARGETVGKKTDIYSLGIVLYEMLTGSLPFTGDTTVAIALKHINEEVPPPELTVPSIPRAFSNIVRKATHKEPRLRYATMAQLEADLVATRDMPCDVRDGGEGRIILNPIDPEDPSAFRGGQPATERRGKEPMVRIGRLVLLAFFILAVILVIILVGMNVFNKGEDSPVALPDLYGMSLADVRAMQQMNGILLEVGYADSLEMVDTVIAQSPLPDTQIRQGDTVYLTVSEGPAMVTVPPLERLSLDAATQELREQGLQVGKINYGTSELPEGSVFSQSPSAGNELSPGDTVDLWLSSDNFVLPDLAGLPLEQAVVELENAGFSLGFVYQQQSSLMPGYVVDSEVYATGGQPFAKTVDLTVSTLEADHAVEVAIVLPQMEAASEVVATVEEMPGIEVVQYYGTSGVGDEKLNLELYSDSAAIKTLRVYIDGKEQVKRDISFQPVREAEN